MYIVIGNFGNHSIAAIQSLLDHGVKPIHFIYVETGWAAEHWSERVLTSAEYAKKNQVHVHIIPALKPFDEMARDRNQFPSQKFQWCASFLKGLAILNHLDELDPACEGVIVSGKRRLDSRRYANLQEHDHDNEYYQGRTIWHPLYHIDNKQFVELISRTGLLFLKNRSMECSPCIHTDEHELAALDATVIKRLESLENQLNKTMFERPIRQYFTSFDSKICEKKGCDLQQFDFGCGAPWGCGE